MNRHKGKAVLAMKATIALLFLLGCARVTVGSKEPIKLDVTMRLDVYQHVAKDVTAIEDMITAPSAGHGQTSFLFLGVNDAYAQEESDFPADVKAAIERRKERRSTLVSWEAKGAIGENAIGLVEIKDPSAASEVSGLVSDENSDRNIIYGHVASKNGAAEDETGRLFAKRIQADAPQGTPVESPNGSWTTR